MCWLSGGRLAYSKISSLVASGAGMGTLPKRGIDRAAADFLVLLAGVTGWLWFMLHSLGVYLGGL
jgi:hypothetical protein